MTNRKKKSSSTSSAKAVAPATVPISAATAELSDPALYINRELSVLAFQRRVLEEAEDDSHPLLERVKFLAILGSNLDEFFMVRVAGLAAQVDSGASEIGPDGMSPAAQLLAIRREVKKIMADAHRVWDEKLRPSLYAAGIRIDNYDEIDANRLAIATRYFESTVFPVLTPLAFDPGRPFPHISNLSLNLAVLIRDRQGNERFARVKVPDTLPQLIPLRAHTPSTKTKRRSSARPVHYVWIEEVIAANLQSLFPGMEVLGVHPFHVTRDADMAIKELEAEDLLESIEEGVKQRRFGSVVRLMVTHSMPQEVLDILMSNLEIDSSDVYRVPGPLGLKRLMAAYVKDRPELKDHGFQPAVPAAIAQHEDEDIFSAIRHQDILMHHPFESFQPVVDLLRKAARDPNVLAIKMTLYRVGRNSPVVEALLEAMEEGKQVAVLVELRARFDEESNIEWAKALEREGVHVVYGLLGLKIHCKMAMIVRREGDHIRRYVHLASGNYNASTALTYTDFGFFTARDEIADDVTDLFNYLTGYSAKSDYQNLLVAPVNLRARLEAMIQREIDHQKAGRGGRLIFKCNSLVDPATIRALYRASQAGVKVDLLIRGGCCLRPGVPGVSDNITVTSIVGRFLEHSRAYYFRNGGGAGEEIYLGSADLMNRNLSRRVEVLFPIDNPKMVRHIKDNILDAYLADTVKVRRMKSDGTYVRMKASEVKRPRNVQAELLGKTRQPS
ncbi:polyphosphate kinase [Bryobacterales bacterium F-183]|nr:polyphosphate kinase [Bryobacterales bacterium F-183]